MTYLQAYNRFCVLDKRLRDKLITPEQYNYFISELNGVCRSHFWPLLFPMKEQAKKDPRMFCETCGADYSKPKAIKRSWQHKDDPSKTISVYGHYEGNADTFVADEATPTDPDYVLLPGCDSCAACADKISHPHHHP